VALDIKMYVKDEITAVTREIYQVQEVILAQAEKYIEVIMPGYTHLQRAQPVLFAHHLMAYFEMLERDNGRFMDCLKRGDRMPLGSGALAGTGYPMGRRLTNLLRFDGPYREQH
jgi:argininosuccinate lyase